MPMNPTDFAGALSVDGYGPGFFRVGGNVHHGPVIVTGQSVRPWGGLRDDAALQAVADEADLLFVGMGAEIGRLPTDVAARLRAAGLMVETMSSPSAARSYNVTLAEGRRVACALVPV